MKNTQKYLRDKKRKKKKNRNCCNPHHTLRREKGSPFLLVYLKLPSIPCSIIPSYIIIIQRGYQCIEYFVILLLPRLRQDPEQFLRDHLLTRLSQLLPPHENMFLADQRQTWQICSHSADGDERRRIRLGL